MKIILSLFCVLSFLTATAQLKDSYLPDSSLDRKIQEVRQKRLETDSLSNAMMKRMEDEIFQNTLKQNERNLNSFLAEQRAREKKESQRLWIRGILALLGFAIAIFAFRRSKKSKKPTEKESK